MKGFISILNAGDFELDKSDFIEALSQRWADTQIQENAYGDVTFEMTIKDRSHDFQGHFYNFPDRRTSVFWYGDYEAFAEFSIWFRGYIPQQYQLEIIDKNGSFECVVSHITTEEEVLSALLDNRYDFEIVSPANTRDALQTFAERFKQNWHDYILHDDGGWYLRSQQGYISYDTKMISFEENDLRFAAHFLVWCRTVLPSDQSLTIKNSKHRTYRFPNPNIRVETELTPRTAEDALYDFLVKSFPSGQP